MAARIAYGRSLTLLPCSILSNAHLGLTINGFQPLLLWRNAWFFDPARGAEVRMCVTEAEGKCLSRPSWSWGYASVSRLRCFDGPSSRIDEEDAEARTVQRLHAS